MTNPSVIDLGERIAIVTGASGGIGSEICSRIAARGATIVLVSRTADRLSDVARTLPRSDHVCVPADLRDADTPHVVVGTAIDRYGRLDIIVNAAGDAAQKPFTDLDRSDWVNGFAGKLFGAALLCKQAWPYLRESNGVIVNVVGTAAKNVGAGSALTGSVNAAFLRLTQSMAVEGREAGIRVNAVNPGPTLTQRLQTRIQALAKEQGLDIAAATRALLAQSGLSRFATPEEVAEAVLYFLSPASGSCSGTTREVDSAYIAT